MLKKAAALLLVCASTAIWVSCGAVSSNYLYMTIPGSNEIVIYREDPNSGILTQLAGSPITAGSAVESLVIHPNKKLMFAANTGESDVSMFTIAASGAITEITPRTVVGTAPTILAMDAAGQYLYVGNSGSFGSISVFSINATATPPTLTQVAGSPFSVGLSPINMAVAPSGNFLYVTGTGSPGYVEAFSLNQGVPTAIAGSPYFTGTGPYGLVIAPGGGFLYTANKLDNSLSEFTINADGTLTQFSNSPIGQAYAGPVTLLIDKSGKFMFVADQGASNVAAYSIGTNGALTLLANSPFATGAQPSVLATDAGGKYVFVGNQSSPVIQSFNLDTGSGTLTSVLKYSLPGSPTSIATTP